MDELYSSQETLIRRISRTMENLKKAGKANITHGMIQTKIANLDATWSTFQAQDEKINRVVTDAERKHNYFSSDIYSDAELVYCMQRGQLLELLKDLEPADSSNPRAPVAASETPSRTTLPKIEIPPFSGTLTEWIGWEELFNSLVVASPVLTDIERFHYLSSSLSGEAAQLIKRVPRTAANFNQAWELLQQRYSNRRRLVDAQFDALHDIRPISAHTAREMTRLLDSTCNVVAALRSLGISVEDKDYWIVHHTLRRLDKEAIARWEESMGTKTEPALLSELVDFLNVTIHKLGAVESRERKSQPPSTPCRKVKVHHSAQGNQKPGRCPQCHGDHPLCFCGAFRSRAPEERRALVTVKKLCLNCLGSHPSSDCRSTRTCQRCADKHHTLLHDALSTTAGRAAPSSMNVVPRLSRPSKKPTAVLLATAMLRVKVGDRICEARALIDPCSEVTLVTESLVQQLRMPRRSCTMTVFGAGATPSASTRGRVEFFVSSRHGTGKSIQVEAFVLPNLTAYRPRCKVTTPCWPHLEGLTLADPRFTSSDRIDVLLGADVYSSIILDGTKKGSPDAPTAHQTLFGWILCGPSSLDDDVRTVEATSHTCMVSSELHDLVQRFWEQEDLATSCPVLTAEEEACEQHFQRTSRRDPDGRYVVHLPFRSQNPSIGESHFSARRMLQSLERRFASNDHLERKYKTFMSEYHALGHMEFVPEETTKVTTPHFYLPHHGVLKGEGASSKLRVVFNGSRPSSNGKSLNDLLCSGPKLQQDLMTILLRWRLHKIAFLADIEKMYRQIKVQEQDRDWQRVLWRESSNQPIRIYRLTTVTYGLSCAPYLALRTLRQLAADEQERYPEGASILQSDAYVDDILSGAATDDEARDRMFQVTAICRAGGFTLKKWSSNQANLLDHLPPEDLATYSTIPWQPEVGCSALGLIWHPSADTLAFSVKVPPAASTLTKRTILSQVAQLFDPLGWLAPVVLASKVFIQSLWQQRLEWDTPLPSASAERWDEIATALPSLSSIRIPRWLHLDASTTVTELHLFSDASEKAYAAAAYLRTLNQQGEINVTLLAAKTKVAPLKTVSLPRLELSAATLAARLLLYIKKELQIPIHSSHLWTDSTIVLAWLRGEPSRWKTFVANRVSEIQTTLPDTHLHHVCSTDNPADCASRGLSADDLATHPLWWHGPSWLTEPRTTWDDNARHLSTQEEERAPKSHHVTADPETDSLMHRYSSWDRLIRITAWCRRWLLRHRGQRAEDPSYHAILHPQELHQAEHGWIRKIQRGYYPADLAAVTKARPLATSSRLRTLAPFLDSEGILRVGGRLRHSLLSYNEQHPIVLPPESHFTHLLVEKYHRSTLHGGTQLTLASIRQKYWILQGRQMVKRCIHRCIRCIRWRAGTASQLMGDLPAHRVTPSRPFLHCGVDYMGPLHLKTSPGRGHKTRKGYVAVFVCFSSRAVHLEPVSDYSTTSFLAAFKRFTDRRGLCETIRSDCGTNFVGAAAELRRLFTASTKEHAAVTNALARKGVHWQFNPPGAPHFGGIWEAAVKSVKHHLRRVIGDIPATFEELSTFLCDVEACLNSRPLQALSDDPEDLQALTPGHFLVGGPLNTIPEPSVDHIADSRLSRWQQWQQRLEHFWRRWATEYLHQLQPRRKWTTPQPSLGVGDLCIIKSEVAAPTKWPLARITEVHPGADGVVRVVTLKTAYSTLQRPIAKLIPLPRESQSHSSIGNK